MKKIVAVVAAVVGLCWVLPAFAGDVKILGVLKPVKLIRVCAENDWTCKPLQVKNDPNDNNTAELMRRDDDGAQTYLDPVAVNDEKLLDAQARLISDRIERVVEQLIEAECKDSCDEKDQDNVSCISDCVQRVHLIKEFVGR